MKVLLRGTLLTAMLMMQVGLPALSAAQSVAVETELIAEIREPVTSTQGTTTYRFVRATVVRQGEVVFYTVKVRNPGSGYARNVVVVQKIPQNTVYVPGSAVGPGVEVSLSVDGGRSYAPERTLGTAKQGESNPQFTHIRWRFRNALAPGAVALARFRAIFR